MFAPSLRCIDSESPSDTASCFSGVEGDRCATVALADLAALLAISLPVPPSIGCITFPVRRIKPGETLHRAGDKFASIHVVRSGCFKSVSVDTGGTEAVLGFPMGGDVVGLDGFDSGRYAADVVALDMSTVAVVPFERLAQLARQHPCIEHLLYSLFSRELTHNQGMFWLLGKLTAEARLATFLLELAERFGRLGYSRTSFTLRMTRQEIGSFLGLKLETVSRTLSAFAAAHLIEVDRRAVTLCNVAGLRRILEPQTQVCVNHNGSNTRRASSGFVREQRWLAPMALAA